MTQLIPPVERQARPTNLDRWGAACGVAFTVLAVASAMVVPPPPASDAAIDTIRQYLMAHNRALGVSGVLMAVAVVLIIGFFAFVYRQLHAGLSEDNPLLPAGFLLAAATVTTTTMLAVVIGAVLVQHVAPVADASTLSAFYALWDLTFHTAPALAMAAALLLASGAAARSSVLPRWTTGVALLASLCALVDVVEDLTSSGNNLGALGLVAFALINVWVVGVAIAGVRRPHPRRLSNHELA